MSDQMRAGYADLRETHCAVVVMIGDWAYKVKKPVDLGFLDFTTRERRLEVSQREVELNRRLSPDVYLGVSTLLGPDGEPRDHLVLMRRMPDSRRLSLLARSGDPELRSLVRQVARKVAEFHERCERSDTVDLDASPERVRRRWQDSLRAVRPFDGDVIPAGSHDEVAQLATAYLDGRGPLFEQRRRAGALVDGHGDLLADDIFCLPDGPRILDCLEFDDHLRHLDRLDDVAFLAMDLERLGARQAARDLLEDYMEFSGDHAPVSLVDHFIAYRAFVRAKVACLRHAQEDPHAADDARLHTELTLDRLRASAVTLVLVGGAPGTGKSTVASGLADRLGLCLLSSDRVRKELAGLPAEQSARASFGAGIYTPSWTARVYAELLHRAHGLLQTGESVVVDATWADEGQRRRARAVAQATSAALVELRCVAPQTALDRRVGRRVAAGSDATAEVSRRVNERFSHWPEASELDTMLPVEKSLEEAAHLVRPWRTTEPILSLPRESR